MATSSPARTATYPSPPGAQVYADSPNGTRGVTSWSSGVPAFAALQ